MCTSDRPHRPASFPFERFRRLRSPGGRPNCPHCAASRVHRWGSFSGRQRYRCVTCTRTFSDFTGTPLANLKHIDRWPGFCLCMLDSLTVRQAGRRLGIHKNTAFRWRHRLLDALRASDSAPLGRSVLIHETWFPYSEKGRRDLERDPRERAAYYRRQIEPAWVVIARDDIGRIAARYVGRDRPWVDDLSAVLRDRLDRTTELVSRFGRFGAAGLLSVRTQRSYRRIATSEPEFRAMRRYLLRLRRWLRRFRGVATRYLDNYLVWHALFALIGRARVFAAGRQVLLAGRFP